MTAPDPARFGADLRLLPSLDVPHSDREPGSDLQVIPSPTRGTDLAVVAGADNLVQALVLRLLTPVGALAALGHPDYGSRLAELIGERNTESNRNRLKLYALQALTADPRVTAVRDLKVSTVDFTRVEIRAELTAGDGGTAVNLVVPFVFEGGTPR